MASSQAIKTVCEKHDLQLNLYCPGHLMPCCDKCISTTHSKCTGIKSLAGVVEKTEIENTKESVQTKIHSILSFLETVINNKSKNIKSGENQIGCIKKSIKEIRQEINKHLDHLEKKLCNDADLIWNQEKSKTTDFISEIVGEKRNLKEIEEHLQTVTTNTSKPQSFLGVHQIEQQVHQCHRYVEGMDDDGRAKEFEIKMKQNCEIENILHKLGTLESLGEIIVITSEVAMNINTGAKKGAQFESQEQSNINNMNMNIETKIEINMKTMITDMICLMDGRVLAVERWGKVNLLTSDGKLQQKLPIPGEAWSVTQINQDTIAITYPKETAIKIFNMKNETVTKVITLDEEYKSLSFANKSLAVGVGKDQIHIIDLKGNRLKSIEVHSKSNLENLVYCNDRVIYSDCGGKAVYCYNESGKQIWQYTQDLEGPEGLCTDTYGNIIVAEIYSGRIIIISKDGQNSKVLINKENGLEAPMCICLKHNESSGFICDYRGRYLTKFNLSLG